MKELSRTKNSILNIFTGFVGQILSIVINFICRTVFIKTLGVEYLGIYGLFADILSMLSLAELGFDTAISFRLYKPIAEKNTSKVRAYLYFFRKAYLIVGGIIFGAGLCIIPFLHVFIADYDSLANLGINAGLVFVLFLTQNVSTYLFFAYRSIILKVDQKKYVLDTVSFFVSILSGLSKIAVLFITRDFIIYILCATSFLIIQNLVNAIIATKAYPEYFKKNFDRIRKCEKIDLFKDCGALLAYKVNGVVMKATDNIVLSAFIGLAIVGKYSNYLLIYSAIHGILHSVYLSVKDSMGNLFVTDDIEKKYFFFEVMNFLSMVLYGTAGIGIAFVSNDFIKLWIGTESLIPQPLPILIGIEMLLTGLKENLAQIRHVSGTFKQMWFRPVIGSAINVTASIILVQYWGISGVILGTILAAIFANLLVDPSVIHKYSFSGFRSVWYYYRKNLVFISVITIVGMADFFFCRLISFESPVLSFISHLSICILTVPIIFLMFFWSRHECVYLKGKVYGLLKKRL